MSDAETEVREADWGHLTDAELADALTKAVDGFVGYMATHHGIGMSLVDAAQRASARLRARLAAPKGEEPLGWVVVSRWNHNATVDAMFTAPEHIKPWSMAKAEAEARRLAHNRYGHTYTVHPVGAAPKGEEPKDRDDMMRAVILSAIRMARTPTDENGGPRPDAHELADYVMTHRYVGPLVDTTVGAASPSVGKGPARGEANEYRPWESEGITELAYFKRAYLDERTVNACLKEAYGAPSVGERATPEVASDV